MCLEIEVDCCCGIVSRHEHCTKLVGCYALRLVQVANPLSECPGCYTTFNAENDNSKRGLPAMMLEAEKVWGAFEKTFNSWWGLGYVVRGTSFIFVPSPEESRNLVWDKKLEFLAEAHGTEREKAMKAQKLKTDEYATDCLESWQLTDFARGDGVDVKICALAPMLRGNYTAVEMTVARQVIQHNRLNILKDAPQAMQIMRRGGFSVRGTFVSFKGAKFMTVELQSMDNLVVEVLSTKAFANHNG